MARPLSDSPWVVLFFRPLSLFFHVRANPVHSSHPPRHELASPLQTTTPCRSLGHRRRRLFPPFVLPRDTLSSTRRSREQGELGAIFASRRGERRGLMGLGSTFCLSSASLNAEVRREIFLCGVFLAEFSGTIGRTMNETVHISEEIIIVQRFIYFCCATNFWKNAETIREREKNRCIVLYLNWEGTILRGWYF